MNNGQSNVNHEVAIVGTGFAGLGMAIRMKNAGMNSFTVFEQAGSVGGTWRYQADNGKVTTLWPGFTAEYRARTMRVNPRNYNCVAA